MDLASTWFGSRARALDERLAWAARLDFDGLVLLDDEESPRGGDGGRHPGRGLPEVGAASWPSLVSSPHAPVCWHAEAAPAVLAALARLRSRILVLPVGVDGGPGRAERGERLLARLRAGEEVAGDEAMEELATGAEKDRERQLEELAALIHHLLTHAPGVRLALMPDPSPAGLLDPHGFSLLAAEFDTQRLGLWHDTGIAETRAAAGLEAPGEWLDRCGSRIHGCALHDYASGRDLLPPGAGIVDWPLLAEYLPREARRVLRLAPSYPEGILAEARTALADRHLA